MCVCVFSLSLLPKEKPTPSNDYVENKRKNHKVAMAGYDVPVSDVFTGALLGSECQTAGTESREVI